MSNEPQRYGSQYEMRFGSRSYTSKQAETIRRVVEDRKPLDVPPIPIFDDRETLLPEYDVAGGLMVSGFDLDALEEMDRTIQANIDRAIIFGQ